MEEVAEHLRVKPKQSSPGRKKKVYLPEGKKVTPKGEESKKNAFTR
jgi:hypothetical protein